MSLSHTAGQSLPGAPQMLDNLTGKHQLLTVWVRQMAEPGVTRVGMGLAKMGQCTFSEKRHRVAIVTCVNQAAAIPFLLAGVVGKAAPKAQE